MKNTGKEKVTGLILKAILITLILFIVKQACAQELTPEVVTTAIPKVATNILEQAERFYEISEKSLRLGYNVTLDTTSAFQTTINQKNRYVIANNFSQDTINLVFINKGDTLFNQQLKANDYVLFKIDDLNLQFILHSADTNSAEVELKLFEDEIPKDVSYFELFDVRVRLTEHEIYQANDLTAIIEFTNFGEGPSDVRIIYSIKNLEGKELYTGIDEKRVETEEVIIKNFNNLKIPNGQYILTATIYYGQDQKATSEESFTLKPIPKIELLKQPAIFIGIVLIGLVAIIFLRKREKPGQ